ncbi:MAG: acetyltransferase [Myxococcales bacterium]|nr:acetyltransferase [Myxococcales bacterium]
MLTRPTLAVCALTLAGCVEDISEPPLDVSTEQSAGETRGVTLRYREFNVTDYEQTLSLGDLKKLPRKTLDELWLLDYDMTQSVEIVLQQLKDLPPSEAEELSVAAQNMRKLVAMTPDNANLEDTKLEKLIGLAGAVGIPPAKCLANIMQIAVTDPAVPSDVVADVFLTHLLGSHPNARVRRGLVDAEHPDGLWDVTPKSLPITLGDLVYNFETLPARFGPQGDHPGFVISAAGLAEPAFTMKVRASLNALPFKGVDLTTGGVASVNSTPSQVARAFDFKDEKSMTVEGLKDVLELSEMTVRIQENPAFMLGGDSRDPVRQGNSDIWDLPEWEFEFLIMEMARRRTLGGADIVTPPIGAHCNEYELGTGVTAFTSCIDGDGWLVMESFAGTGEPPPPAYFWDMLAEVAQWRLHDPASPGDPAIPEGEADVEFTLKNVQIPVDQDAIFQSIRDNFAANPDALADLAKLLNNNAAGDADFYYVRSHALGADYLYFVTSGDLRTDAEGALVRPYAYEHVGFYGDATLANKVSSAADIGDGDDSHEKVRVDPGDVVFVADDAGHVFQLAVGDKPDRSSIHLEITRVR